MFKKPLLFIALFACVVNLSGCLFVAAGAAGVGTAKWISDKATQELNCPIDKALKATREALKDDKAVIFKETQATDITQILAKDANKNQIWVDLRPVGVNTNVGVRVGYLNGEKDARRILESIVERSKSWL